MAKTDFDAIKRTVDVVAVIEGYGVSLKKEGKDWIGLCPFHMDKKPSLRVTPGKGLWRCMSCEAAGDAIRFVAKKDGLTDKEAALKLLAGLPGVQRASRLEKKKSIVVPPNVAADLLNRVAAFYHRILFKDKAGLDYLASRNLADPAMLETFRVGYCNGTLKNALPKSGEVIRQLQALGILNDKGNEVFYGRITVPIMDGENVVSFYGRKVEPGKLSADSNPHMYLAGGHKAAFNAAATKSAERIIFTEAILDALSLWQAGHRAVIALYGKGGWTEHHERAVRESSAQEIVLALDNDQAGRNGTETIKAKIAALRPAAKIRVIAWPEGVKDANAFFSSRSAAEFAALIDEPKATTGEEKSSTGEKLEPRDGGFVLAYPNRRYEVIAVEKTGATRLRATVKALGLEPGRFHVETIDLYSAKARRLFAAEAARLFKLPSEITEADLDRLLAAAEQRAGESRAQNGGGTLPPAAPALSAQDTAEAMKFGKRADLVGEIMRDLKKLGIIGEERNAFALYLAMTSRKMDDPLPVHTVSSSGAGKSYLQDTVLSLCPEEDLIKLTALTDQALFYKGEDSLRHKCLAVEEVAGAEGARYAVRNLISAKKLTIEATIKNPLTGKMETQTNTVYGPTAVFETTTQPNTDAETKSRFILLSIDESAEQTRLILIQQRERHTLEAMIARKEREAVRRRHHAFQRLLRPLPVHNPYERLLSYGDDRLATRRDQPKYLNLIATVAFLHQMQRPVKHNAVVGDYIEVTLDDIAIANDLANELFGASLDDLSSPSRNLACLMADYVAAQAAQSRTSWEKVDFTRRELREAIKWSDARLRIHLGELVSLEYLAPLCGSYGSAFRYRLLVSPEAIRSGARLLPGLRPIEELRRAANLAGLDANLAAQKPNLAGQKAYLAGKNDHLAGTSQPAFARLKNGATALSAREKETSAAHLAGFKGEHIPALNGNHQ